MKSDLSVTNFRCCQSCPQGTFNNQIDGECRQWTQCLPNEIVIPGTETEDVTCRPKDMAPSPTAPGSDTTEDPGIPATAALAVASVLSIGFLLTFCTFFTLWARKKIPAVFMKWPLKPPVQEVEDCSCRYPEEEEGGGGDTSGPKGQLLENIP
uniref:Uncharacterized protein n=1 Tax=Sphaerodactylus townsendi TaxID=933632 RepID=A0ACB8ECA3_9SAUR